MAGFSLCNPHTRDPNMAVNLPPQYHDAEAEYKKARTPEEKLVALKKMWVILPKHKASEKVQVILKTKISEVSDEIEQAKAGPKKASPNSFKIPKQGAGQVCPPRSAERGQKPAAVAADESDAGSGALPVHHARADPGMMEWEDVRLQLIDLPPITAEFYEPFITDFTRGADAALLLLDLGDDDGPFSVETVIEKLRSYRRILVGKIPENGDDDPAVYHLKTLLVANKIDADGAADRLDIVREMFAETFPDPRRLRRARRRPGRAKNACFQAAWRHSGLRQDAGQTGRHGRAVYDSCRRHGDGFRREGSRRFRRGTQVGKGLGKRRLRRPDGETRSCASRERCRRIAFVML